MIIVLSIVINLLQHPLGTTLDVSVTSVKNVFKEHEEESKEKK